MRINTLRTAVVCVLALIVSARGHAAAADSTGTFGKIRNDCFWYAADSIPVYSQGGGIFRFTDPATGMEKYYWYGVRYEEAEAYLKDPSVTPGSVTFRSVTCYSSTDLVNWKFEGDVFDREELRRNVGNRSTWVGRMGVAYIKEAGKYALVIQHAASSSESSVLIAVSDTPAGKYEWHNWFSMRERIGTPNTGDQTVFTDEDTGKSYLVYSYGRGRSRIYLSEIGVRDGRIGLLDCHQIYKGPGREGNCMFKYKGKYYMCASDLYGWDASHVYYLMSDNIYGPYQPVDSMEVMDGCMTDYGHVTQTGFFVTVHGSKQETVVYCGDRWAGFAGNGLGYNQWCPLSFNGERPFFNSLNSWSLNTVTGEWRVEPDNNYVMNASFEADRRPVPNPVKPRQDWLTGWTTTVIKGSKVSVDSLSSPRLNYLNTQADRRHVVGEKSLNISDEVPFERNVSQMITSMPNVELPDGTYTLTAKVCRGGKFAALEMYAESSGRRERRSFARVKENRWATVTLKDIKVRRGRVEIGFRAAGNAGAWCRIDDVELRIGN